MAYAEYEDRVAGRGAQEDSAHDVGRAPGKATLVEAQHEAAAPGEGAGRALPRAELGASADAPSYRMDREHEAGPAAAGAEAPGGVSSRSGSGRASGDGDGELGDGERGGGDSHGRAAATARTSASAGRAGPIDPAAPLRITSETKLSAADGPNTRLDVGVGEVVYLRSPSPGTWKASAGTKKSAGEASKFTWTAPSKGGSATITLKVGAQTVTKTFTVHEPKTLAFKMKSVDKFPDGQQGVGMFCDLTIGPTNVSFGNTEWLEVPGPATKIWGYFKNYDPEYHHPNPDWLRWNEKNTSIWDHASLWKWPKPWSEGGFEWAIPNKWRVAADGGKGHVFKTTHQVFHMHNNKGKTTVSKGGVSTTRTP